MYRNLIVVIISLLGLVAQAAIAAARPNVIVMVADDLGWADVGFHDGNIETPALDRLAAEGVELNRFYTTPICSPTRAALMTGRNPMRLGVALGVILPWDNNGVHPDEHFMPQSFEQAGYQTAMVGKWHLGHAQMTYHPNNRGFEHFYGHLHTEVGFFPPFANQGGRDFQRNGVSIDDQGYETFLLADEVSRYIRERDQAKPFFVYMPFIAPHTPLDAPQELQDKYKDIDTDLAPARSKHTDDTRDMARLLRMPSARPMYAAVVDGMDQPRDDYVFFGSEVPIYGSYNFTVFNDDWKLMQEVEQNQLDITVTNHLFRIEEDPYEYNNLAAEHPEIVARLAQEIHNWRALYPINGTRSRLVPPPGWRAPLDWATYPIPLDKLQSKSNIGMAPTETILRILDRQHGERGRLVYNCSQRWWSAGFCIKQD